MFPWIANWGLTLAGNVMRALGTNAGEVGFDALEATGTNYNGLYALGNGAPLTSLIWGCIAIFAIRNRTVAAAISAGVGGVLAFFGIIHAGAPVLGGETPTSFLIAYAMVAALFVLKWFLDKRDPSLAGGAPADEDHVPAAAVATASTSSDPVLDGTERAAVGDAAHTDPAPARARPVE
ncbi:hypothetical protein [Tessaracoccus flavus]|uniref:Uncharacterized protein n=1 Tax=Tessaracoccus flavus TaxID=1610493 RepID=A0A1Q2CBU7_9ACTN|nr:hypothetical protein [Tessaracoccus flavus]AQP43577.1 hypothetical protein RPIT_01030 [Tessaracoccus flavus]SDY87621.1 hypothetical protein SAMN05428934_105157 [Tessaracoccus flavus]